MPLFLPVLAVAVAALAQSPGTADATTAQHVREVEWSRADPVLIAPLVPGADADTRRIAAVALGRLRDARALDSLGALREDPDPAVRAAVATALGATPGGAAVLRTWLDELAPPHTPAERVDALGEEWVAVVEALGASADPADVPRLAGLVGERWPIGPAAARALGRMSRAEGIEAAIPALVGRLDASDPRTVEAVAWALSRIGLTGPAKSRVVPATELDVVARRLGPGGGVYETTRAWLVRAAWTALPQATRDALFVHLASDPSRLVRVAFLGVVGADDVEPEVLAAWLADPDPWIRYTAIDALGKRVDEGSSAASILASHASRADDVYERAAAIRALHAREPERAADATLPAVVRAAYVEGLDDRDAWVGLAVDADVDPVVRSAAAGALLADEDAPGELGAELLGSRDPAVREAGVELVGRLPPAARVSALALHLRLETNGDVLAAGLNALVAAVGQDAKALSAAKDLGPIVARGGARSEPRVRAAAVALAAAAHLPPPPLVAPGPSDAREIVLPSGEVAPGGASTPSLAAVAQIRGAVVHTSEGSFVLALDPATAPVAVANFAALAEAGFYDDLVFHRVVPGFVVQTGCPRGDGWGGPGYTLPDEVSALPYDAGALGMARADRDTGGSQWFVTTGPQPHLVGQYTRFGEVVEGMQIVKRLRPGSRLVGVTIERVDAP